MSTSLSSAATPRSSSLAVPATQGTAPVVKFRCLFTHDMRRKAKRWQDGFLRFHTFNKRVMVYDNTGYFIGDLHWRAPEGIQDGDELELDKGVLIQVCEPLERSETDISSLYKNKSQTSPSHPGEEPPSFVRSTIPRSSLSSQQAPRSLNDLLGIRKTPTPQLLSPYEQRHGQRQIRAQPSLERPTKRQRTTSPERISRPSGQQDIVDLSGSPAPEQRPRAEAHPNQAAKLFIERTATIPQPRVAADSSRDTSTSKQSQPHPSTVQSVPQNSVPTTSGSEIPVNTLRLSSENPRRKLMYQESSQTSAKPSQPRTQLSRAHSQCEPMIKHEASSPTIINLDEEDPVSEPPRTQRKPEFSQQSQPPQTPAIPTNPIISPKPEPSQLAHQHNNKSEETPMKSPLTGLRKSYSDPTTINNLHTRTLPTTSPPNPSMDSSDEQGPWTSEALDLFEFWPPGRPKPT
ncbi:hypothetical protein BDW59DRAFT_154890 [Aspergillus cavernicola]|uniref:5'-3' DNA helicase ZGRF1-like N-terminal domain-containing protein n=1 Tax=Aspergillus cavernicola TaxID=176166 RepID=A0ABR4HCX5_9EURO